VPLLGSDPSCSGSTRLTVRAASSMSPVGRYCSKTILSVRGRNIDSRSGTQAQHGFKDSVASIRWLRIYFTDFLRRLLQHYRHFASVRDVRSNVGDWGVSGREALFSHSIANLWFRYDSFFGNGPAIRSPA